MSFCSKGFSLFLELTILVLVLQSLLFETDPSKKVQVMYDKARVLCDVVVIT